MGKKLTTEQFVDRARKIHNNLYTYDSLEYEGMEKVVQVTCRIHGNYWQRASDHVRGFGCSDCSGKRRLTTERFVRKAKKVHFNSYDYSNVIYVNLDTEVSIVCPKHGEFLKTPRRHLYGTRNGCPKCCYSKGELYVHNWLESHKIPFIGQETFDGCVNPATNYKLRFDFYVPSYNLCIEVDGVQHQTEKHYLNNIVIDFTGTKERDQIKEDFCLKSKIKLRRLLWDKNYSTLEDELKSIFL